MKEFILLKEGNYVTDAFAAVMEAFNDYDDRPSLHYLTRTSVSVILHANVSSFEPEHKIALAHHSVNPQSPPDDFNLFNPINMVELKQAADEYGIAVVASLTEHDNIVPDSAILGRCGIVVRNADGHLIDYISKKRLTTDTDNINSITLFSLINIDGLPLYYLITDSSLVKIGDGFDFFDEENDIVFRQSTESDGKLKDTVFIPTVNWGNTLVNNNIFAAIDLVEICLFDHPDSLFASNNVTDQLEDIEFDITSNFQYSVANNKITVDVSSKVGYITIMPKLGRFSTEADMENIKFEFSIFKI